MKIIRPGLDRLLESPERFLKGNRIGLVVNQTSLTLEGESSIARFARHSRLQLCRLFAPEHGIYGVDQDMVPIESMVDPLSGLAVESLYGTDSHSLAPDPGRLNGLDHLIFDIQDVGSRYYTFVYTMAHCMETCRQAGVSFVVCDRPNPIGGVQLEGNRVSEGYRSFVGQYPLPNRHAMTAGELARLFNEHFGIHCDLTVVPMEGWSRDLWFDQTGLRWVPPSPNMPTVATATVYPGMCLVEGTRLSEGRGTTLPFEQTGAPFIDPLSLAGHLNGLALPGVFFRPHFFKPTFHKFAGQVCGGIQLHVTDRERFRPVIAGVATVLTLARLYPEKFEWRTEPYEFVGDRPAIDLLYGNDALRTAFAPGTQTPKEIEAAWAPDLAEFSRLRENFLIY